ncbi:SdrD B-like domain-containing protein [Runella zeae]|uniref:SdrD B-like domain-containing protein n=1 Tax=Runella zeae TaxID=94255 RepID=UPI002356CF57|nr:SdrD B-like domain-containing protein [Runella zeae]
MKLYFTWLNFLCLMLGMYSITQGQVSGVVFRDFNANGARDSSATFYEVGVANITVKAFNTLGVQIGGTQTTDANGAYAFSGLTFPVKIEFSDLQEGDSPGPQGSSNATSVQFLTAPSSTSNLGINYAGDYCETSSPRVAIPCYINGDAQAPGNSGVLETLVSFPYENGTINKLGNGGNTGSLWSVSFHRQSGNLFSAAFGKRHVNWGPLGPNGLYVTSNAKTANDANSSTNFVNLNAVNPAFDAGSVIRNFNPGQGNPLLPSYDENMFEAIGKVGLGGIECSDDGQYLYVVNLNDRQLWRVEVGKDAIPPSTAAQIQSYPAFPTTCNNSTFRPFAVKVYKGFVYVGGICDAVNGSTVDRNNLSATIYRASINDAPGLASWTNVLSFPLTFNRKANMNVGEGVTDSTPYVDQNGTDINLIQGSWHPWVSNFGDLYGTNHKSHPQPMLSDIEFDVDGSMIMGFMDRTGHQVGVQNYSTDTTDNISLFTATGNGDIMRAYNNNGVFELEDNGKEGVSSPKVATAGAGNEDGPGGGEFYHEDRYAAPIDPNTDPLGLLANPGIHDETSIGGISLLAGKGTVLNSVFDPRHSFDAAGYSSGGARWYSNNTGNATDAITLYTASSQGGFGKASGLGDVEVMCDAAPIEIGNRVWLDTNNNGIQEAGEPALAGVTVFLFKNCTGTAIATATTDANGSFYFSSAVGTSSGSVIYNLSLENDSTYCLKITSLGNDPSVAGLVLTNIPPAPGETNGNLNTGTTISNNDAFIESGLPTISFQLGGVGQNNHTYDFGISPCISPILTPLVANNSLCEGDTIAPLEVNTTTAGLTYQWYGPLADTTTDFSSGLIVGADSSVYALASNQLAVGTYYYAVVAQNGVSTCADTAFVQVIVNLKPNAGNDVSVCLPATTAQLTAVTPSGTWAPDTANPTAATIDNAGNVSGLTVAGTYKFIYTLNSCSDTAQVIVKTKPNAGADIIGANALCISTDTTTLAGLPFGGSWSLGNAPWGNTAIVTTNGAVSGLNIAGIYELIYEVDGCTDTLQLEVKDCCVKPQFVVSAEPVCAIDNLTYSVSFTVVGQLGTVKVSAGTLSGNNPYTVSGVPNGISITLIDSLSAICKFDTLISGPNCNCSPRLPIALTPSQIVCIGDTFPTLQTTIVGLATAEWFDTPTGGSPLFTGLNYKPNGTVAASDTFYVQARSLDAACPVAISSERLAVYIVAQDCRIDLALNKLIDKKIARIGDTLTYTVKLWNESLNLATGVEVTDSIPNTVELQTASISVSRGGVTLVGNTIKWNIDSVAASGDTVILTYKVRAISQGLHFNKVEITKTNEQDVDSTPNNNDNTEDDLDVQCFTVPFTLCTGEAVEVNVPAQYTNVQWFKDGNLVNSGNVILLTDSGEYTFTASNNACPTEGCCPVIIEAGQNCCPTDVCIPVTLTRTKKGFN